MITNICDICDSARIQIDDNEKDKTYICTMCEDNYGKESDDFDYIYDAGN